MSASEEQAARLLGRGRGTRPVGRTRTASERQAEQLLGRDGAPDGAEEKPRAGRMVGSRGVDGADKPVARRPLRSATEVQAARLLARA